jgi:HEAT repeat protein
MANAVFAGGDDSGKPRSVTDGVRRAGAASLMLVANKAEGRFAKDPLPVPDDALAAETTLAQLVPEGFSVKERAAALVQFGDALRRAAQGALSTSSDRARAVLDAMSEGEGAFEPFVGVEPSPDATAGQAKAREIVHALESSIVLLARHPDAGMRTRAVVLLARMPGPAAADAVLGAVSDPSEAVQRVALAAIGAGGHARAVTAVAKVLRSHENWAMRVLAAQALGRLGKSGAPAEATRELREATAAAREPYALVREAALVAIASYDAAAARAVAQAMSSDPEPRVRDAANRIVQGK